MYKLTAEQLREQLDWTLEFRRAWAMLINGTINVNEADVPSIAQCNLWVLLHNPVRMLKALSKLAHKNESMQYDNKEFSADYKIRTFSSYANHLKSDEE